MYLGYVPYGCVLFDRTIAAIGVVSMTGLAIYDRLLARKTRG